MCVNSRTFVDLCQSFVVLNVQGKACRNGDAALTGLRLLAVGGLAHNRRGGSIIGTVASGYTGAA